MNTGWQENSKYYLSGTSRFESFGDTNKIFSLEGLSLKEIYSSHDHAIYSAEIDGRIYFSRGKQISRYVDSTFTVWKDFTNSGFSIGTLWGRTEKDIFSGISKGIVYGLGHYDGTDLVVIYPLALTTPIYGALLFPSDIFLVTHDGSWPIMIHGVLK